jgi:hypothetical protein
MPATTTATTSARLSTAAAISLDGVISGAFDLTFAFIYYGLRGATPVAVLQSVAGGLVGRAAANSGGAATAVLGFFLHFLISFTAAAVYCAASRPLPALARHAVPCGLLYGALVYFFMNMIVLPLSAYHSHAYPPPLAALPIIAHVVGVGLPIALAARRSAP